MKALPLVLVAVFLAGCSMKNLTSVLDASTPTPVPTPRPTPAPKPKQGDWMFKNYKNPLDPPKR